MIWEMMMIRPHRVHFRVLWIVLILASSVIPLIAPRLIKATDDQKVLLVALPSGIRAMSTAAIEAFERENPDIQVNIIEKDVETELAVNSLDKHLQGVQSLVRSADVVFADA